MPVLTNTEVDWVSFFPAVPFTTGTRVRVSVDGGGLLTGTDYFLRGESAIVAVVYHFYTSEVAALAGGNTGRVDLTGDITATVAPAVYIVGVVGVSPEPYEQGPRAARTGTSRTDSVDSDADGLTDYDEYFLATDSSSKDTDSDGIPDRVEVLGYALDHQVGGQNLGIIKTDPLDADTDNDLLSDGAEAELTDADFDGNPEPIDERSLWVVRVRNAEPYRAFSNPLVADADFDGIVDGAERPRGTDPNNGNTDGDQRDDGVEIIGGTNPLAEDFRVRVFFNRLTISSDINSDGDGDGALSPAGEIVFDLAVRLPGTGVAGLSTDLTHVVTEQVLLSSPFNYQLAFGTRDVEPYLPVGTGALQNDHDIPSPAGSFPGIAFNDGDSLNLVRYVPVAERSFTFGMTPDQSFAVEALVGESDSNALTYVYLGGVDGVQGRRTITGETGGERSLRPVFLGAELQAETSPFIDVNVPFTATDNYFGGYPTGTSGVPIAGTLYFTIFIG